MSTWRKQPHDKVSWYFTLRESSTYSVPRALHSPASAVVPGYRREPAQRPAGDINFQAQSRSEQYGLL
jgi:hypothetical protein